MSHLLRFDADVPQVDSFELPFLIGNYYYFLYYTPTNEGNVQQDFALIAITDNIRAISLHNPLHIDFAFDAFLRNVINSQDNVPTSELPTPFNNVDKNNFSDIVHLHKLLSVLYTGIHNTYDNQKRNVRLYDANSVKQIINNHMQMEPNANDPFNMDTNYGPCTPTPGTGIITNDGRHIPMVPYNTSGSSYGSLNPSVVDIGLINNNTNFSEFKIKYYESLKSTINTIKKASNEVNVRELYRDLYVYYSQTQQQS